jgi:hypothetical protein
VAHAGAPSLTWGRQLAAYPNETSEPRNEPVNMTMWEFDMRHRFLVCWSHEQIGKSEAGGIPERVVSYSHVATFAASARETRVNEVEKACWGLGTVPRPEYGPQFLREC